MKAFTSIEQSKKLADILPLESADMCYLQENGEIIKEYSSIMEAAKTNNLSYASVYNYLRGKQKTCKGRDFKYKDNVLNIL